MGLSDSVRLKLNGTFNRQLYLLDENNCIYQVPYKVQTAVWFSQISSKWEYISIFPDFIKRYCTPCLHLLEYISCQAGKGEDLYRHIDDPEAILDCEDSITRPARRIEKECMKLNYPALLNSRYMCIYNSSSENNTYIAKFIERKADMESVLSQGEEQRLWVENHKDSNDPLDMALVKYFNYIRNSNNISGFSSKYEPEKDEGLKYLSDLGDKETDKMIDRIEKNDVWAGTLMCAVEKIKKIDIPSEYKDASPAGTKKWVAYVKEKIK